MSRHEVDRFMALEQAVEDAWLRVLDGPWAPEASALELEDMRLAAVELASAVTMLLEARDRPQLQVIQGRTGQGVEGRRDAAHDG